VDLFDLFHGFSFWFRRHLLAWILFGFQPLQRELGGVMTANCSLSQGASPDKPGRGVIASFEFNRTRIFKLATNLPRVSIGRRLYRV
jgi:hypothetical protein